MSKNIEAILPYTLIDNAERYNDFSIVVTSSPILSAQEVGTSKTVEKSESIVETKVNHQLSNYIPDSF